MNRLQRELQRLYAPLAGGPVSVPPIVRALVLELGRPADGVAIAAVWGGVQADLALPAAAIAVNGRDGYQLWFSLQEPVPVPRAREFLDAVRQRYLADTAPARVTLWPAPDAAPAPPVPALQADSGLWSAFVTPDLAPVFADTPWLDGPPNPESQGQLLAALRSIAPAEWAAALQRLGPAPQAAAPGPPADAAASDDPERFLLDAMNDGSLDMGLRIEAAKALLPSFQARRAPQRES